MSKCKIENPEIDRIEYFKDSNGISNAICYIKGDSRRFRGRSEGVIVKGNKVFLYLKPDMTYKLPGGSWEPDESHEDSCKREIEEEVHMTVHSPVYTGAYISVYDKNDPNYMGLKKPSWVDEKIPKDKKWVGYFTEVYGCEYKGKYTGHVNDEDLDEIIRKGKWYLIEEVYNILLPIHKKAINMLKR